MNIQHRVEEDLRVLIYRFIYIYVTLILLSSTFSSSVWDYLRYETKVTHRWSNQWFTRIMSSWVAFHIKVKPYYYIGMIGFSTNDSHLKPMSASTQNGEDKSTLQ